MPRSAPLIPIAAGIAAAALAATGLPASASPARPGPGHDRTDATAAARVITEDVPSLGTAGGVRLDGAAFGSAWTSAPRLPNVYYGLTDRGPNVDGPDGSKVEPLPSFTPMIGEFVVVDNQAHLVRRIPLRGADGTPYNGRVSTEASTGETIVPPVTFGALKK